MLETRDPRPGGLRRFSVTFALLLAALLLWSAGTPVFGAADENQHMIMAYAVAHGEWPGRTDGPGTPTFEVPAVYSNQIPCFALNAFKSAGCQVLAVHGPDHRLTSTASSYPPFYAAAVGWPTWFSSGLRSLYLMRAVAAAWVALFLALALDSLGRVAHRGPLLLGLAVAMTPVVFFFGAVVNPIGLAIASGFAAWTGGLLLVRGRDVSWSAVARLAVPLGVFVLMRRDSLYWGALMVAALAALVTRERARRLVAAREVWVGAAGVGVCAVVSLLAGGSDASSVGGAAGSTGSFWNAVSNTPQYLQQLVGILGWLDTYLPFPTYALVGSVAAFLLLAVWCFGSPRIAVVTGAIAAAVLVVPLAIGTVRYPYFQGRYQVAFAAGLVLVAALGITERLDARGQVWPRRALVLVLVMVAAAQVMAFAQMLRRFSAGATGDWWIFTRPQWRPPHGSLSLLVVLFVLVTVAHYGWLYQLARSGPSANSDPPVDLSPGRPPAGGTPPTPE